jgi:hypothetical protein
MLTKETAAVCPLLIALDMAATGVRSRRLTSDVAAIAVAAGAYGLSRVLFGSPGMGDPLSPYVVQRSLFNTFGGYGVPWHALIVASHAWLPLVYGLLILAIAAGFCIGPWNRAVTRRVAAGAGWVVVSVLPAFTFLFIAPDLQQSRYLYLGTAGWALTLVVASSGGARRAHAVAGAALAALIAFGLAGSRLHQRYWRAAADMRDAVEHAAASNASLRTCGAVDLRNLPDSVAGAYVFRNGVEEAFARDVGISVRGAGAGCAFRWDGERFVDARR